MTDVFICYSRQHPVYADIVEFALKKEEHSVWRDTRSILPADPWQPVAVDGVSQSTVLVVIITKEALESPNVRNEVKLALKLHKPYVAVNMIPTDSLGKILESLELDNRQAIDCPAIGGWEYAEQQLCDTVKRLRDTWTPLKEQIDRLGHFSPIVRKRVVKELGVTADKRVLSALVEAFEIEVDDQVKTEIYHQMSNFDDERALYVILHNSSLASPVEDPKEIIERMMQKFDAIESKLASAIHLIKEEERKLHSAMLLCRLTPPLQDLGLEVVVHLAKFSSDFKLRNHARYLITQTKHPRAEAVLNEMLENEEDAVVRKDISRLVEQLREQK